MTNTSQDAQDTIRCARCERDDVTAIGLAPFPNELGQRISAEVCEECWEAWKHHQMLLINHCFDRHLEGRRRLLVVYRRSVGTHALIGEKN
jgi:Fe-S cluster biosynthesis and repair protein YggX